MIKGLLQKKKYNVFIKCCDAQHNQKKKKDQQKNNLENQYFNPNFNVLQNRNDFYITPQHANCKFQNFTKGTTTNKRQKKIQNNKK